MAEALGALNRKMPRNAKVRLRQQGKSRISITPFEPLPAAPNLEAIKTELERRWPMTDLIDVLMETARQTGFLEEFTTSGDRVVLNPDTLRQRLVLCLRSEEHTSELQSLMRISYAVFCLKKKNTYIHTRPIQT